jgi:DNA-binding response OmpR family regulator
LNTIVIEDSDDLRETMVDALHRQGHQVTGIDCAEALPDQSAWQRVDIMVVDLNLPVEDGLSLVARARSVQPDVGIIMVTARNQPKDRQVGYSAGADNYLTKPFSLQELNATISSLGRRIQASAAALPAT